VYFCLPFYYNFTLILHLAYHSGRIKHATQKVKKDWNFSTRSSRLCIAPVVVPMVLWSLALFCFERVILVFRHIIYIIIILYS
jgi:hypothetical protein